VAGERLLAIAYVAFTSTGAYTSSVDEVVLASRFRRTNRPASCRPREPVRLECERGPGSSLLPDQDTSAYGFALRRAARCRLGP